MRDKDNIDHKYNMSDYVFNLLNDAYDISWASAVLLKLLIKIGTFLKCHMLGIFHQLFAC